MLLDQLGLSQDERLGAVLERVSMRGEPLPPNVLFGQLVGIDERAH